MTTFDKRKDAAEAKFSRDQELAFKYNARCKKLLGLWAAEQIGLDGAAAEAYAKELVLAGFNKPGGEDVVHKVREDLAAKGIETSEHSIRKELERLLPIAREQILTQIKPEGDES